MRLIYYTLPTRRFVDFLKHTRKTFKEILNEYRIAHACKLLAHTDKSIEAIAYESGYGNQSFLIGCLNV